MSDLSIREATEVDLPGIMALLRQLGESAGGFDVPEERAREHFEAMQNLPDIYTNLVAEADGQVIGFLSLLFFKSLFHTNGTAQINELVVTQGFRGQGIGGKLIQAAIQEAHARGLDEIEVSTEKDNLYAQHFYQKMGFSEEYLLLGMEFEEKKDARIT